MDDLEEHTEDEDPTGFEFNMYHVMERERAEREGREIHGPAENAADVVDAVRVPIDNEH
ncbi:hypothetical protein [Natrialba sp. INN-245]|uniref:hypothetical protein n=1 Tax=Natrialba sp. INN-245 TaxID=2690967 RepID=UPI001311A28A|nr:hypothetical protein [Natrialba sp. INN-245]MWV40129.1 hypothetical protein [Natrialba sp. INN-245]